MKKATKFGVSLDGELLTRLDDIVTERGYASRSQAIADFTRRAIVKKDWDLNHACAGVVSLIFRPEEKNSLQEITVLLARESDCVLSQQNFPLSGGKIFSVIAVKGKPARLQHLADLLRGLKGVESGHFSITGGV